MIIIYSPRILLTFNMILNQGDKVYDTMIEKYAIVVNLQNDYHE